MFNASFASVFLAALAILAQAETEPVGNGDQFYLGMNAVGAATPTAKTLGIESPAGAVVTHVDPGGPARSAGLQKGDLITWFGNYGVASLEDLVAAASFSPVNEALRLTFVRGNRRFDGRLSMAGISRLTPPASYTHPEGAYRLRVPFTWRLEKSGKDEDGPFDLVESYDRLYRVKLFWASKSPLSQEDGLAEFARSQRRPGSVAVRATIAGVPAVWDAYPQGESPRVVVYDIALAIGRRQYRIQALAPALSDPERLPLPLRHFFAAFKVLTEPATEIVAPSPPLKSDDDKPPAEPRVADARFRVPAAWRQLPAQPDDAKSCVLSYTMGSASSTFHVLRMGRPDEFLAWVVKEFEADLGDLDTVTLAGSPAIRIAFSSQKRGVQGLLLASEQRQSDGRAIAFLATSPPAEWAKHEPAVTQVFETIRFQAAQKEQP